MTRVKKKRAMSPSSLSKDLLSINSKRRILLNIPKKWFIETLWDDKDDQELKSEKRPFGEPTPHGRKFVKEL